MSIQSLLKESRKGTIWDQPDETPDPKKTLSGQQRSVLERLAGVGSQTKAPNSSVQTLFNLANTGSVYGGKTLRTKIGESTATISEQQRKLDDAGKLFSEGKIGVSEYTNELANVKHSLQKTDLLWQDGLNTVTDLPSTKEWRAQLSKGSESLRQTIDELSKAIDYYAGFTDETWEQAKQQQAEYDRLLHFDEDAARKEAIRTYGKALEPYIGPVPEVLDQSSIVGYGKKILQYAKEHPGDKAFASAASELDEANKKWEEDRSLYRTLTKVKAFSDEATAQPDFEQVVAGVTLPGEGKDVVKTMADPVVEKYAIGSPVRWLTEDEKNIYKYFYATDPEKADAYLSAMEEIVNSRIGSKNAADIENLPSLLRGISKAFAAPVVGIDQFGQGIRQAFSDEALPVSSTQYMGSEIKKSLKDVGPMMGSQSLGQHAFDFGTTLGNMAPSILLSAATGGAGAVSLAPVVGAASMGLSSGGNAIGEALREGKSLGEARAYGLLVGASEAGLSYVLGGVSKLGGKLTGSVGKAAAQKISGALGKVVSKLGVKMIGEFSEEYLQEILDPVFRNIVFDENNEFKPFTEEALTAGIMGALSAGLLEGKSTVSQAKAETHIESLLQGGFIDETMAQQIAQNPGLWSAFETVTGVKIGEKTAVSDILSVAKSYEQKAEMAGKEVVEILHQETLSDADVNRILGDKAMKAAFQFHTGASLDGLPKTKRAVVRQTWEQQRQATAQAKGAPLASGNNTGYTVGIEAGITNEVSQGGTGNGGLGDNSPERSEVVGATDGRSDSTGAFGGAASEAERSYGSVSRGEEETKTRTVDIPSGGRVTYRTVRLSEATPAVHRTLEAMRALGIRAEAAQGPVSLTRDGITQQGGGNATTLPDGSVVVQNGIDETIAGEHTAAHEYYHSAKRRGLPAAFAFEDAVSDQTDYGSADTIRVMAEISNRYLGKGFPETEAEGNRLNREFTAYIAGALADNVDGLDLPGMFSDFGAVQSAFDALIAEGRREGEALAAQEAAQAKDAGADGLTHTDSPQAEAGQPAGTVSAQELFERLQTGRGQNLQRADMSWAARRERSERTKDSGKAYNVDPEDVAVAQRISKRTGRNIQFSPELSLYGIGAYYDRGTDTIYVSSAAKGQVLLKYLGHELTHSLEGSDTYTALSNYVLEQIRQEMERQGYTLTQGILAKKEQYADYGKALTTEGAQKELVAEWCAQKLFTDEASIRALCDVQPSLARRILNWFRKVLKKLSGTPEEAVLKRAEELYHNALMAPYQTGEGVQYSIQTADNGEKIVVVDADQGIFVGERKSEYPSIVRKYLKKKYQGVHLPIAEYDSALFGTKASGEYAYPRNRLDQGSSVYSAKMKASTELQNLLRTAEYAYHAEDTKGHPEATQGWDYYQVNFLCDGKQFSGLINIAVSEKGRVFYDITKLKEVPNIKTEYVSLLTRTDRKNEAPNTSSKAVTSMARSPATFGSLYDPTVSQDTSGVNTSISENGAKDTQASVGNMEGSYLDYLKKYADKAETPLQVAKMDPREASTTPPVRENRADRFGVPRISETEGDGKSRFLHNLQGASILDERFKENAALDKGVTSYHTVTNEGVMQTAKEALDRGGYAAVTKWFSLEPGEATAEDVAMGFLLMHRYQMVGDAEGQVNVARHLRKLGTKAGQTVQAFSILGRLTPEAMVYYAQRDLDAAFEYLVRDRSNAWIEKNRDRFRLTREDVDFILDRTQKAALLPEGRDKNILLGEIAARIQDKLPHEKGQAMRALGRIAMLLNPKTNVRNILGNVSITPVSMLDDMIGSIVDKGIAKKTGVRTTGTFKLSSFKGFAEGAANSFDDFRRGISTRDVEADRFDIGQGKSFDEHHTGAASIINPMSKALNALDRTTGFLLELGDRPFFEMWFMNSINNQKRLNHTDTVTPEMIEVARQDALSRTWQDSNEFTKFVGRIAKSLNIFNVHGYGLGDILIKFVKTPANLTKAVVDYSPVGLVKSLALDAKRFSRAVSRGEATPEMQRKFVNALSKGITGTLITVLTAILSNLGLLSGKEDGDPEVADFERNILGKMEYSVQIGGKSFDYTWVQPFGTTAAIVADVVEQMKGKKPTAFFKAIDGEELTDTEEALNSILSALQSGGQVLYNQSFMQSLSNLFAEDDLVSGLINAVLSDPSAFVPQFASQIARLTDDTSRRSYEPGKPLTTAKNRILSKLPWLRQDLEPVVDTLGRDVENSQNPVDVFFNPANWAENRSTPEADEIYRIYKATGDAGVLPPKAPATVEWTTDGVKTKITLSGKSKTLYQRTTGRIVSEEVGRLMQSGRFETMEDTDKADIVKDIYDYANAVARSEVSDYELKGTPAKIAKAEDYGISAADYLLFQSALHAADDNGSIDQKETMEALNKTTFSQEQKAVLWSLQNDGWKKKPYGSFN